MTEAQEPQLGTIEAVAAWVGIVTRDGIGCRLFFELSL